MPHLSETRSSFAEKYDYVESNSVARLDIPAQFWSIGAPNFRGIKCVSSRMVDLYMVEIPESLRSVFSAAVHERDGSYVFEILDGEVEQNVIDPGGTYRIAVFPQPGSEARSTHGGQPTDQGSRNPSRHSPSPPVDEGEVRQVTIETVGDQGDGIAKVDRGYVVIVSGAQPGEQPTIEIDSVRENVAFASVVDQGPRTV